MLKTLKFKVFEPVRDQSPTHQSVGVVPVVLDLSLVPLGFRPSRRAERGQQRRTQHSSRPHGTPKNTHTNRRDFFIIKKVPRVSASCVHLSSRCFSRAARSARDVWMKRPRPLQPSDGVTGVT